MRVGELLALAVGDVELNERSGKVTVRRGKHDNYTIQAGIDSVNPHALRHTFATCYLNANPDDLRGLARLLGHSSLDTVMIYTEPNLDELAQRMERVEVVDASVET